MRTTISLPKPLFKAADELAKRLGMSYSELCATAVEEYLRAHCDEGVTEALNRVYGEEGSALDPVLATLQSAAVSRDDW
jgi:metal-responsive CopG/Arc/MetJ family transcriptional regulator